MSIYYCVGCKKCCRGACNNRFTLTEFEREECENYEREDRLLEQIEREEREEDEYLGGLEYFEQERKERENYEREDCLLKQIECEEQEDDDSEVYSVSIKCSRLTCEYRPEEEVHDMRFDILCMDSDDPYLIPNPVLEDYGANAERRKRDADVDDWDNALKRETEFKMCCYCEKPILLNYETMENVEIYKNMAIGPVMCYACFQGYVDEHGTSKICLRN